MVRRTKRTNEHRREWTWALWFSLAVMAVTCIPLVVGYAVAEPGTEFLGFPFNVADSMVYLSWMRQAADGHFFLTNLFTSEPQRGIGFNLLFFVLGTLARVSHLPLIAVYQIARIVFGVLFLLALYRFSAVFLRDVYERRLGLAITALSAGLGWFFALILRMDPAQIGAPDLWQPEAITFTSIHWSPTFAFPLLLMVAALYLLLRFEADGTWRHAAGAGLALGVLANVHTYDALTLGMAWLLYCAYRLIVAPRTRFHDWWQCAGDPSPFPLPQGEGARAVSPPLEGGGRGRGLRGGLSTHAREPLPPQSLRPVWGGLVAALVAGPLAAYQLYFYLNEPLFRERVATATVSPHIGWILAGYGLLVPLAVLGILRSAKERRAVGLLVCWAAAGIIGAYLPVAFQRKLIMGTHIPLSLLAAIGVAGITAGMRGYARTAVTLAVILLLMPTNLMRLAWNVRDIRANLDSATGLAFFVSRPELDAIASVRRHAGLGDVVLAPPQISTLIPGLAGRQVFCGHWGECPDAQTKTQEAFTFFSYEASDQQRREFLENERISFVVEYHGGVYAEMPLADFRMDRPDYLKPIFEDDDVAVYRVRLD